MTVKEFLAFKEDIRKAEIACAKLEGQREMLLKTLRVEHGCFSIEEAHALLTQYTTELANKQERLDAGLTELGAQLQEGAS